MAINVTHFIPYSHMVPIMGVGVVWKDHYKKKGARIVDLTDGCLAGCVKWLQQKGHAKAVKILTCEQLRRQYGLMPPMFEKALLDYSRKPETKRLQIIFFINNPN
jgi:hypothetical protein